MQRGGSFSTAAAGLQNVECSPGYTRLSPTTNLDHFSKQWLFLWSCAGETLTRERFDETPEIAQRHIDPAVFQDQSAGEAFPSFVARLRLAYEATINELTMMAKPHRIPHEDTLVPLVFTKAKRGISLKVLTMLQTTETLRECDMIILAVTGESVLQGRRPQTADLHSTDRCPQCAGGQSHRDSSQSDRSSLSRSSSLLQVPVGSSSSLLLLLAPTSLR